MQLLHSYSLWREEIVKLTKMGNCSLAVRDTNLKKGDASPMKQMKKAIEWMNTVNSCIY